MYGFKCCPGASRGARAAAGAGAEDDVQTILVVDDEAQLRELVAGVLADPDHRVLTAADGYEALRILERQPVDLLLTDVKMPGLNGFELARQARFMHPRMHVIYVSGYHTQPADGRVLMKPVRLAELVAEVALELRLSSLQR